MKNHKKIYSLLIAGAVIIVVLLAALIFASCAPQPQGSTATPARTPVAATQATPSAPAPTVAAPGPTSAPAVTSTAQCSISPVRAFGKVYSENPNVARALGCAQEAEKTVQMAEEEFQKGFMFWRSDTRQIYVIMNTGRWAVYPDTWKEGDPSPSIGTPAPAGTTEPVRGFGKVWREQNGVRDGLGWATTRERGLDGLVESFVNGTMLWSDSRIVFVLLSDGTWLRFADAS